MLKEKRQARYRAEQFMLKKELCQHNSGEFLVKVLTIVEEISHKGDKHWGYLKQAIEDHYMEPFCICYRKAAFDASSSMHVDEIEWIQRYKENASVYEKMSNQIEHRSKVKKEE